ncbi:unnamed protein product [Mytilus coruscus]|uniref:Uncharacterized protein n=1 Tax=Mytilus coruscus TaxID=42192 RepID=A0A6J7ZUW7_MYTCO|nr:unnamed protein product [Mytilus coruscus]
MKIIILTYLVVCGFSTFVHAAPILSSEPWIKPCAGSTPSSVNFITTIVNVNTAEVVKRLSRKTKLFLTQMDGIFSHVSSEEVNVFIRDGHKSNSKHQHSNTKHQQSNTKHQQSNTKHQQSNTKHQQSNTKHQQSNTKHQQSNTKHQHYSNDTDGY